MPKESVFSECWFELVRSGSQNPSEKASERVVACVVAPVAAPASHTVASLTSETKAR